MTGPPIGRSAASIFRHGLPVREIDTGHHGFAAARSADPV
jgi:hypothetical protein